MKEIKYFKSIRGAIFLKCSKNLILSISESNIGLEPIVDSMEDEIERYKLFDIHLVKCSREEFDSEFIKVVKDINEFSKI